MLVGRCSKCGAELPEGGATCARCGATATPFDGLSIVIPAYNEAHRIGATVRLVLAYATAHLRDFELLVVDDGSTDGTADVVREAGEGAPQLRLIANPGNRGKGYSVKAGALAARFPYVLFSDADLSTPIEELEKLAPLATPTTLVIASRGMDESDLVVRQPIYRETMGKIFNLIVRTLLIPGIRDTQCGFKLFGREVAQAVFPPLRVERWAFDVEVIARALRAGFAVREVPVRWRNDERSRVDPLRDSTRMLLDVVRVSVRLRTERFGAPRR